MAYQYQEQQRPMYDQRPSSRNRVPQQHPPGPRYDGGYPQQLPPQSRGAPRQNGYYDSGFWAEYGAPPIDQGGYDQGYHNGPDPHNRGPPGNFSRPQPNNFNGDFGNGPRGPPQGRGDFGDPRGPPRDPYMNGPPQRGGFDNGYGPGPGNMRQGPPPGMRQSPPRQRQMRGPLVEPSSPKMGFDNPFPVFPANQPIRSNTVPLEHAMGNMNMNGRPSMENSRPPTSGSKASGRSNGSMRSERSFRNDPHGFEPSFQEPHNRMNIGGPPFDPRGPPPRSMTMPNDMHNDRRPSTRQGDPQEFGFGPRIRDPMEARSHSSAGMRSEPGFGPPSRAQTFDTRPVHGRKDTLDDYMPNFDGPEQGPPLEDALGIPLDSAPGIARPAITVPMLHQTKSQPDLRAQSDEFIYDHMDAPPVPRMPGAMPMNGQRAASPDPYMNRRMGPGGPGGPMQGPGPFRPGMAQRLDTNQSAWSDPGPRNNTPMSASVGGPPGGSFRGPPPGRMDTPPVLRSENPDGLPSHPMPVRPGLMQNGGRSTPQPREPPQRIVQERPPQPEVESEPPVTLANLEGLRFHCRNNPNDNKEHLHLARRLMEASNTLADEDGQADAKTRAKNREKYVMEAYKTVKKLVQHSDQEAMFFLADAYGNGDLGLAVDHKEAFGLYQAAAKLGHAASAYRTAVCCEIGGEGTRKDPIKAVQWYRRAAALGDVSAMYKLGMILLKGLLGQQQSVGEGVIWLNRAAERADEDNPHAVYELASLHEFPPRGGKIIADEKYSLQLYQQAARLGYRMAQTRLGKAFEHGQLGCPMDDRASIHWYSKAASQEDAEAELALSAWYLTGARGVLEPNETEAYLWARKAALREYPKAEFAMGHFSEVGIGCPVNLDDAKRWYGRAASHNYIKAQEALENLRKGGRKQRRQRYSRSGRNEECTVM